MRSGGPAKVLGFLGLLGAGIALLVFRWPGHGSNLRPLHDHPVGVERWQGIAVPVPEGWTCEMGNELKVTYPAAAFAELVYRSFPSPSIDNSQEAALQKAEEVLEKGRRQLLIRRTQAGYLRVTRTENVVRGGHDMYVGHGLIFMDSRIIEFRFQGLNESDADQRIMLDIWEQTYWFGYPANSSDRRSPQPSSV